MMQTDSSHSTSPCSSSFPIGGGETGRLIRVFDWSKTALGPLDRWPQSLKTTTQMLLLSPVPIVLLWGETGIMIYNDAYSRFAGSRHPQLLGSRVREGWPEIVDFSEHVMKTGLGGGALVYRDQEMTLNRNGRPEQVWMSLDYSPVLDESGQPSGVIAIVEETTERVRIEQHLLAESSRLANLFEQAPGLMAMLRGPDHVFELANSAYLQLVGSRDLIGRPVRDALPEIARQGFIKLLDEVYRSGKAYVGRSVSVTLLRQPGELEERHILDFVYQPVFDAEGAVTGIFVEGHDVTERAQGEERVVFLDALGRETANCTDADSILAVTTRMLGQQLGASACAYVDVAADQDALSVRGGWSSAKEPRLAGHYSLDAIDSLATNTLRAGNPLILNDNHQQLPPDVAAAVLDQGLAASVCVPLLKEDRLSALMTVHNKTPRVWTSGELALIREVTERSWAHIERSRAEAATRASAESFRQELEQQVAERTEALARSEAQIRTIFETSHLYQGLLDVDGFILYANATALAVINTPLEQVVGLPFWKAPWFSSTPGMAILVKRAVKKVLAGNGASENMSLQLNLPGGPRTFDFSLRPVMDENGLVSGLVPEAVDATLRTEAEKVLHQAHKMEALGNLSGGIAHDFNNLLMAILGNLELLHRRLPEDPSLLKWLGNARAAAKRGASLTSRMLAFARKQDLIKERIDLRQLVEGMTDLLDSSLGSTVTLDTRFANPLALVETDPNQLESALLNLAVNARDAMAGVGHISIAAYEEILPIDKNNLRAGRYVCLSVSDSGKGMDEATLKRATEPFFTTKDIGKGTGLGLSMVHGLAEQSGGTLQLTSTPQQGTTATIWLPALNISASQLPNTERYEQEARHEQIETLTILAVDDDELVLTNTADLLRDHGHHVLAANSAREALLLLEDIPFDLVITDHAMPHMTGSELAAEIRKKHPQLPVLLVSGYTELPAGTHLDLPRLSKPFSQHALLEAIRHITRG